MSETLEEGFRNGTDEVIIAIRLCEGINLRRTRVIAHLTKPQLKCQLSKCGQQVAAKNTIVSKDLAIFTA